MPITGSNSKPSLHDSPYLSYTYAYPHKTAYRLIEPSVPLAGLWEMERRDRLFLYIHLPFCEMRCGFCNLFTTANPKDDFKTAYLTTLARQARQVRNALGSASFARLAIGGGTPTYLDASELSRVLDIAEGLYGINLHATPISIETSPGTAGADKLNLLRERGVDRISIGVQSFDEKEANAAGRPQKTTEVEAALARIKKFDFPVLNIDLIYGLPGQSVASWLQSLKVAMRYEPQELYLYPLYTRPLTGLGRTGKTWDDLRLKCYRAGRDFLLEAGYEQISMRMFRPKNSPQKTGPVYCCQEDGMVGLGCGARSYTRALHYSSEYAVSAKGVRNILADYIARPDESFQIANYGFFLDEDDQRRRYIIQSLLQVEGLSLTAYMHRFDTELFADYSELGQLIEQDYANLTGERLSLTSRGIECSDLIGPWLYSSNVRGLMEAYELR